MCTSGRCQTWNRHQRTWSSIPQRHQPVSSPTENNIVIIVKGEVVAAAINFLVDFIAWFYIYTVQTSYSLTKRTYYLERHFCNPSRKLKMSSTDELAAKLARRQLMNEDEEGNVPRKQGSSVYAEFKEFSMKQIKDFKKTFEKYDIGRDNFIDLMELKMMMEKLGVPQTHVSLKNMIKEVDEDLDNKISFREFMLIFKKAAAGELDEGCGLYELYTNLDEIDVDAEGVKGAKNFFQAKIEQQSQSSKFENEIKQEQEEKKKLAEEKKERQKNFKEKANIFQA